MNMDMILYLMLIGIVYALIAIVIQRKLTNPLKSIEVQIIMQERLKEIKDLAATDKELYTKKQQEVSKMMMDNMKQQFKPLIVTFPMFLGVFYWLLPYLFSGFLATTPELTILSMPLTYSQFFIAIIFVIGMVASLTLQSRDKKKVIKRRAQETNQTNNNVSQSQ